MRLETYRGHAIVVVDRDTHWCGYVDTQRDYDEMDNIPLDAPGGITWARHEDGQSTVGFHTGRYGMLNARRIDGELVPMRNRSVSLAKNSDSVDIYDEEAVLEACRDVVDQLYSDEEGDAE